MNHREAHTRLRFAVAPGGYASLTVLIMVIIFALTPTPAIAETRQFAVQGTFDDGSTFGGLFSIDTNPLTTNPVASWDIITPVSFQDPNGEFIYDSANPFDVQNAQADVSACGIGLTFFGRYPVALGGGKSTLRIMVPGTFPATFDGGDIITSCSSVAGNASYEDGQIPGLSFSRAVVAGLVRLFPFASAGAQLGVTASVNQRRFDVGQVLTTRASVDNPGLEGTADLYLGVLLPDGETIVFWTGRRRRTALGRRSDVSTYRPYATGVSLATHFSVTLPDFSHLWEGTEAHGGYVLFNLGTRAGALAGGTLASRDVLGVATAPFLFR